MRSKILPKTQLVGVVKATAYGSSSVAIAKRLVKLGVSYLAVAYVEEGEQLRKEGIKIPIMVFYPQINNLESLLTFCLEPCLYSQALMENFKSILLKKKIKQYPIHIKYNTGLNRLGFSPDQCDWVIEKIKDNCFKVESIYSHLAASEAKRPSSLCEHQIELFKALKTKHEKLSDQPPKFHLLNSSGFLIIRNINLIWYVVV